MAAPTPPTGAYAAAFGEEPRLIRSTDDAVAFVRDAVVLLDNVLETGTPDVLPDTLTIALASGALLSVRVTLVQPDDQTPADPGTLAGCTDDDLAFGNGVDWTWGEQHAAVEQGWALFLCGDGAIVIEADDDSDRWNGPTRHADAFAHVEEGARGGHAFSDDYRELCSKALAVVAAVTGFGGQG